MPELRRNRATIRIDARARTQGVCELPGYFEENLGPASSAASRSNKVALSVDDLSVDTPIAREMGRPLGSLLVAANNA
jgi:hypothetical protein